MASALEAPLMGHHPDPTDNDLDLDDDERDRTSEPARYDAEAEGGARGRSVGSARDGDDERPGLFVWLLTLAAGISGLLFGCALPHPSLPPVLAMSSP